MAGSYSHVVNDAGQLIGQKRMHGMLDYSDTGDVYEAIEEMFGMIWYLANGDPVMVEEARRLWEIGLVRSPGPHKSRIS